MWKNIKSWTSVLLESQEKRRKKCDAENIFLENIADHFPNLVRGVHLTHASSSANLKQNKLKEFHARIIIKLLKTKDKVRAFRKQPAKQNRPRAREPPPQGPELSPDASGPEGGTPGVC